MYDPGDFNPRPSEPAISLTNSLFQKELQRSGIDPLQKYFDPRAFTGPNDPKIGGMEQHESPMYRGLIITGASVFLLILVLFVLNLSVPESKSAGSHPSGATGSASEQPSTSEDAKNPQNDATYVVP